MWTQKLLAQHMATTEINLNLKGVQRGVWHLVWDLVTDVMISVPKRLRKLRQSKGGFWTKNPWDTPTVNMILCCMDHHY